MRIHYAPPPRGITLMAALQGAAAAAARIGLAPRLSQPPRTSCLLAAARLIAVQLNT